MDLTLFNTAESTIVPEKKVLTKEKCNRAAKFLVHLPQQS